MKFYVNRYSADRQTPPRTTIHRAECAWAVPYRDNLDEWQPFETFEKALAWAETKTRYPVNCCKKCNPSAAIS